LQAKHTLQIGTRIWITQSKSSGDYTNYKQYTSSKGSGSFCYTHFFIKPRLILCALYNQRFSHKASTINPTSKPNKAYGNIFDSGKDKYEPHHPVKRPINGGIAPM